VTAVGVVIFHIHYFCHSIAHEVAGFVFQAKSLNFGFDSDLFLELGVAI
jgi:hypothetical protein